MYIFRVSLGVDISSLLGWSQSWEHWSKPCGLYSRMWDWRGVFPLWLSCLSPSQTAWNTTLPWNTWRSLWRWSTHICWWIWCKYMLLLSQYCWSQEFRNQIWNMFQVFHSDFMTGWDEAELQNVLDNCENNVDFPDGSKFCGNQLTLKVWSKYFKIKLNRNSF